MTDVVFTQIPPYRIGDGEIITIYIDEQCGDLYIGGMWPSELSSVNTLNIAVMKNKLTFFKIKIIYIQFKKLVII